MARSEQREAAAASPDPSPGHREAAVAAVGSSGGSCNSSCVGSGRASTSPPCFCGRRADPCRHLPPLAAFRLSAVLRLVRRACSIVMPPNGRPAGLALHHIFAVRLAMVVGQVTSAPPALQHSPARVLTCRQPDSKCSSSLSGLPNASPPRLHCQQHLVSRPLCPQLLWCFRHRAWILERALAQPPTTVRED